MTKEVSHDSQELFHLIAENVRDFAVFATDLDGRVVSWNPGVGSLLGYSEDEWIGQHASIIGCVAKIGYRIQSSPHALLSFSFQVCA